MDRRLICNPAVYEYVLILAALWGCAAFILRFLPNAAPILPVTGIVSGLLILAWLFPEKARTAGEFCFRRRWVLALLVFLLCVGLRLHGSSIGVYDEIFPAQITAEETTLFGVPRWIRSDEYGTQTPAVFSQAYNHYRMKSTQMSLNGTNMVLDDYGPVWFSTAIGTPLMWGFLLFGNEIGLSWYWCGFMILLFMSAMEMFLILTQGKVHDSLLGAVMIWLSPQIQWWVMPIMPLVTLYAMGLFCVGYHFFTAKTARGKWGSAVLAPVCIIGYAVSLFPSFQVPFAYIMLTLLVVCLYRDREQICFGRRDWLRLALPALLSAAILLQFLVVSKDDLSLFTHTIYPGRRVSLGGTESIRSLFVNPSNMFLPYRDIPYSNNCEVSTYIHFAPFFLALAPRMLTLLKAKSDRSYFVGIALTVILTLEIIFLLLGIPSWLSELTLLRFCNRMGGIYHWTGAVYTEWGISVLLEDPGLLNKREKILWPLAYAAICVLLIDDPMRQHIQFQLHGVEIGELLIWCVVAAFALTLLFTLWRKTQLVSTIIVLMMFFCGGTVNPVERGTGAVVNHPVASAISAIAEREPESRWLCLDCAFYLSNYVLANGARVLDATTFYPDPMKWDILDPLGQYADITNRYANQSAELTEGQTSAELLYADQVRLRLNPESLKKLTIRYVFTPVDHTQFLKPYGISCEYIAGQDGYGIYRLQYD